MQDTNIRISIALCTYNGESFIKEQLASIAKQTLIPDEIVICDDCSNDNTVTTIRDFEKNNINLCINLFRNEERLGVIKNFEKAVGLCSGEYIALCDQDDIWLPDKLCDAFNAIKNVEEKYGHHMPVLVHSDLCVVDQKGNTICSSFMAMQRNFHVDEEPLKVLLIQNFVTGCTVLMNRNLINKSLPIPECALMHDWWFALVAAATGKIILSPQINILYRQHSSNAVGASSFYSTTNLRKVYNFSISDKFFAKTVKQIFALKNLLYEQFTRNKYSYLHEYTDVILEGGLRAAITAHRLGIVKQGWLIRQIVYFMVIIRGKYKKYIFMRE